MQETYSIILKAKEFMIPSNFRYFNDVDPNIRQILLEKKQYIVKSDIQEETLESFISFWINKEIPDFTKDNISEFEQLSQEFDIMKEVLLIHNRSLKQIQIKENQNQQLILQIERDSIKYQKIIDILFSKEANPQLKDKLFEAIQDENIDKINLYTQNTFQLENLLYILNENDQTAGVILCVSEERFISIPYSIFTLNGCFTVTKIYEEAFQNLKNVETIDFPYNSKLNEIQSNAFKASSLQYIFIPKSVKKIGEDAFSCCHNLKAIIFEPFSELNYIGERAFGNSSISNLSIPSNYIEFGEDWCYWSSNIFKIEVSISMQNRICMYDNQFLLMKDDPKSDIFDILLLAPRNIISAKIPPFIKKISPLAFHCCRTLEKVEFTSDSQLKIIDRKAFNECSIVKLIIPSSVEIFGEEWCSGTINFINFILLKSDRENIISYQNKMIFGKTDLNSEIFDILLFTRRDIKEVTIPSYIKIMNTCAFEGCQIESIEFSEDSELISIEKYAFMYSKLKRISIPYKVTKIGFGAFHECQDLNEIEIPTNSELREFADDSLYWTIIESLYIPSKVEEFGSCWCDNTALLNKINISPKNEKFMFLDGDYIVGKSDISNSVYDVLVLARRNIRNPIIPSFIKKIASCAFNFCSKFDTVKFTKNSELEIIDENAFSCSSLKRIKIPSSVKEIKNSAFDECFDFEIFELEENSQLRSIECNAFNNISITSFLFPSHLRKIEEFSFNCDNLQIIEISEDIDRKIFSFSIFGNRYPRLIMVPAKIGKEINFY